MKNIAHFVVRRHRMLAASFLLLALACAACIPFVSINYDDTLYLPAASNTKAGLARMNEAFSGGGSATCMLENADVETALAVKAQIEGISGVSRAIWLDDVLLPLAEKGLARLSAAGDEVTNAEALTAMLRAFSALKADANETPAGVLSRFGQTLSQREMQIALAIFQNMDIEGFQISLSAGAEALKQPLGAAYQAGITALKAQMDTFRQGDSALFQLSFVEGDSSASTVKALREIERLPYPLYLSGNAAITYDSQRNTTREVIVGSVAACVVVLAVLTLFSSSWIEPAIYIAVIGASVLVNMGSNALFHHVSYLTNSIACILQMVLSIDYAIFLLSRYKDERANGHSPEDAMKEAFSRSLSPISASSLTTIACFITIMFMQFKMGLDMGLVLGKGIVCSLLGVFLFLPGLILRFDKALVTTKHRTFPMEGGGLSRAVYRFRWPIIAITLLVVIPGVIYSSQNQFMYGSSATQGADSAAVTNRAKIEAVFGRQETLALLLPKDDTGREAEITRELAALDGVLSVTSYAQMEASGYANMIPRDIVSQLDGDGWRRVMLNLDAEEEGAETKRLLARIRENIERVYGEDAEYYLLGNSAAAVDMEDCTAKDYARISWLSLIAVAVIVAITFKSPFIAVLLVLVIEGGIRVNMAIPCLQGEKMAFIGYMIIVNILLGSTIDYAILVATHYIEARRTQSVRESVAYAHRYSLRALATSAGIFALGGAVVSVFMSSATVQLIGRAILRGGICAFALTVFALPALLAVFDKWIAGPRALRFRFRGKA